MVSTLEGIAIAEICVYIPTFLLAAFVVFRHGFQKQLGWIYLLIFCLIRLVGAGFKIASINSPTNTTDIEWAAILQSVGLSPLLLATFALLKRVTDTVSTRIPSTSTSTNPLQYTIIGRIFSKRMTATSRRSQVIQIASLPIMIALVLCIFGGTDSASSLTSAAAYKVNSKTKIGIIIFLVIYILLFLLVLVTMKDVGDISSRGGEKRVYLAVVAALPLLGVRLLCSLLSTFDSSNADFSLVGGKPWINFFMAVVEEFIIVMMYVAVGISIPRK